MAEINQHSSKVDMNMVQIKNLKMCSSKYDRHKHHPGSQMVWHAVSFSSVHIYSKTLALKLNVAKTNTMDDSSMF